MSTTRYASVLGLGFGDCGKGHFIDALARRWQAHTVVRFNGGAQAGHNVVTSAGGATPSRHHTFSQFGAGTFVPGVGTLLLDPTVVHPTALLVEAERLAEAGIHDALARLTIDAQCRITTPYHQAAGRLRERLRGTHAHGTCGVGVGETVRHALRHPDLVLRYGDLLRTGAGQAKAARDRVQAIRTTLLADLSTQAMASSDALVREELQVLEDASVGDLWLNPCRALARQCPPASEVEIHDRLVRPGCVLFEGAQGILLDEWRGFHPHTTWSSITTQAVDTVAARYGIHGPMEHYGVLRSYLTRHGQGPLPTHDAALDGALPEPHNHAAGWQGPFRRGHPDAVLLRYALEAVGELSGLLVSHLDVFERGVALRWCERYLVGSAETSSSQIERLPMAVEGEGVLSHQEGLTALLYRAQPEYAPGRITSAAAFLERVSGVTALPVRLASYGPTSEEVLDL